MEENKISIPVMPIILLLVCIIVEMFLSMLSYHSVIFGSRQQVTLEEALDAQGQMQALLGSGITRETALDGSRYYIIPKSGATITIKGSLEELHSIAFDAKTGNSGTDQLAKVSVSVILEDTPQTVLSLTTYQFSVTGNTDHTQVLLSRHKKVSEIRITFAASNGEYQISQLGLNTAVPRFFSFGRFFMLLVLVMIAYLCIASKIWNISYDPSVEWHRYVFWAVEVFCILMAFWVYFSLLSTSVKQDITYPLTKVSNEQCYVQQFDAFMKKRLSLDVEPSNELMALENPYDKGQRDGVSYLWDRAYYDGKYYSYFGAAPVILVYYPYYFCFHKVPAAAKVMLIYTVIAIIALFAVVKRLIRIWDIRANLLLLLLGTFSAVFASGAYLLLRGWASVYYIASLAGLSAMLVFIWVSLAAYEAQKTRKALGLFCFAGICLVVTVASRVNQAVMGIFFVLPLFVRYLREKRSMEKKINAVVYFMVPAILGAGLIMAYNGARFGNPLEFGSSYQLTVSDVRQNHMGLDRFLPSIYHSFLQTAKLTTDFPFVQFLYSRLNDYGYYVYVDSNMGVYMYPLVLMSLGALVLFFAYKKKGASKQVFRHRCYMVLLIGAFLVSFLNFSIGGVHFRYTYDFCCILALVGLMVALELYSFVREENEVARKSLMVCFLMFFVLTIIVGFSLLVNEYNGNFVSYSPSYWARMRDFFSWR